MKKSSLIFLFLAVLISSAGIISLLRPGFFLTDDGNSMVIRFSAFYEAARAGQFPVRFLPRLNNLYGYPVADFLYPLFMYIGIPIKILGFSFVDTVKIIFGLSFIFGTIFCFLWLRKLFDEKSAFIGSIAYSLFPYHLFDIYKRGSIGEVLALGIVPFILWQIERRSLIWGAIGISLLIVSHNTLAILFLIFIFLYASLDIFVENIKKSLLHYYTSILVIGLGLSSFFWLPAIFDLQYTVFLKTQVSDWSKYFSNFGLIGVSTMSIVLLIIVFIITRKIEFKKHRLTALLLLTGVISIFFASRVSFPLWNLLPVSFIQFPFRFLSLTIVSTSFLAACLVFVLKGTNKIIVAILILVLAFFSSREFLSPKIFQNYPDTFYSTNLDSTTVKNEYMPKWVEQIPDKKSSEKAEIVRGSGRIENLFSNGNKISFDLNSQDKNLVQINTIYFPGWELIVDGKKKDISYHNKYGIIQFEIDKGVHKIEARFGETNIRLFADFISLASVFGLFRLRRNDKII